MKKQIFTIALIAMFFSPLFWRGAGGKPLKIRVFQKKVPPVFILAKSHSYKHQIVNELNL